MTHSQGKRVAKRKVVAWVVLIGETIPAEVYMFKREAEFHAAKLRRDGACGVCVKKFATV